MLVQARIRFYDKHKLVPIVLNCLGGQSCARRDSLEEVVLLGAYLKEVLGNNAQLTLGIYRQSQRQGVCATQNLNIGSCACQLRKAVGIVVEIWQRLLANTDNAVAPLQARLGNCRICDTIYHKRNKRRVKTLLLEGVLFAHNVEYLVVKHELMLCALANNLHLAILLRKKNFAENRVDILHLLATDGYDAVTILEAQLLGTLAELVAVNHILIRDILRAIRERDAAVDEKGEDNIHCNACNKHQKTLPSGFCAILPRLWCRCQLLLIHALIDHSCNLAVTAERQPTETILRIAPLLLP